MPAFARESFYTFARDGRVKFDHGFAPFDWRIGPTGNDAAGFDQALPGISSGQPVHSEPAWGEEQIANRVRRLH